MKNVMFSFSAVVLSLGVLGGSFYAIDKSEAKGSTGPVAMAMIAPPKAPPVDLPPPAIELPASVPVLQPVKVNRPKASAPKAKVAASIPAKEQRMVCGEWQESNYGGRYRKCDMQ